MFQELSPLQFKMHQIINLSNKTQMKSYTTYSTHVVTILKYGHP